jgi:hypothetical protein
MVALSTSTVHDHRLCDIRETLCRQHESQWHAYKALKKAGNAQAAQHFRGAMAGIEYAVRLLNVHLGAEDMEIQEASRLAGRTPGDEAGACMEGPHTLPARTGGAWRTVAKAAIVAGLMLGWCLLQMGGER